MGQTIKILTHIHAGFGGIALLAGLVSMIAKKRLELHKIWNYILLFNANFGYYGNYSSISSKS
jgi:hypothetical protein